MGDLLSKYGPYLFPLFFLAMWLLVTTLLSGLSGWYILMTRYPDRQDQVLRRIGNLSGSMGLGVALNGILTLEACRSGLRVKIWRMFGPFSRPFYVPWNDITVVRARGIWGENARFLFGKPETGYVRVEGHVADRLAQAVTETWPEPALPAPETASRSFNRIALQWLLMTAFAGSFFAFAPRLIGHGAVGPPLVVAYLFPAVVYGVYSLIRYFGSRR